VTPRYCELRDRGPRRLFLDADRAHWSAADGGAATWHCSVACAGGAAAAGKNCWVTAAEAADGRVSAPGTGKPKIILPAPSSGCRRPTCSSSSATARAMPSTPPPPWKDLLVAAMAVPHYCYHVQKSQAHTNTHTHGRVLGSRLLYVMECIIGTFPFVQLDDI
jgi:hypothetical protein